MDIMSPVSSTNVTAGGYGKGARNVHSQYDRMPHSVHSHPSVDGKPHGPPPECVPCDA